MAGGWASALGAAILGANQGYQQSVEFQNKRKLDALQAAILNDKVAELPKDHARDDMKTLLEMQGSGAYNNPAFVNAASVAGTPIPTKNILNARVKDIESGAGTPSLNNAQMATRLGVAPNTGAEIPLAIRSNDAHLQRQNQMDQLTADAMQQFAGGNGGSGGYDLDPKTGQPANTAKNRRLEFADPFKTITTMYGSATEMPENVLARDQAAAAAKAEIPPALLQRVAGNMNETIGNLSTAQRELERLYPGIEKDPNAYNGVTDIAKAAMHRAAYGYMNTPYEKAIQNASLANIQEWSALVPGRINQAMVPYISNHQGDYGKGQSPSATYARNQGIIDMLTKNKGELLTPMRATPAAETPVAAPAPQGPVAPPPGSIEAKLGGAPTAPVPALPSAPSAPAAAPSAPPAGATPPAVAKPPAAPAPGLTPKRGDTMKYSELVALTAGTGRDPKQLAAQLKASGINVVMDGQPAGPAPAIAPPAPGLPPNMGANRGAPSGPSMTPQEMLQWAINKAGAGKNPTGHSRFVN